MILKGGWTNRFTTDYDSKFKINALVIRRFCTPYFWSSEHYSEDIVRRRTLQYAFRTVYRLSNPRPVTLQQHIDQEVFVARKSAGSKVEGFDFDTLKLLNQFYAKHKGSHNHNLIFNFLYGDAACNMLGYPAFGIDGASTGFDYARLLAYERNIQPIEGTQKQQGL